MTTRTKTYDEPSLITEMWYYSIWVGIVNAVIDGLLG